MSQVETGSGALPAQPTPLLGRGEELELARGRILADEVRLLTVTGPGGVGKTRLALAVAEDLAGHPAFPDGVRFVDLAPLREPSMVLSAIRGALGVPESDGRPMLEALIGFLAERRLLLVLDNCEHLLAAAPDVGRLLAGAPGLTILATSREPLHSRWEHTLPLGPLALPDLDPSRLPPPRELAHVPAVALFLERARAARPDFTLAPEDAPAVARLVVRLDGLPLAIELAAARAALLGPAALVARLEQHLPLPVRSGPDAPQRHHTLQAAIAWSHDLLTAEEQTLFRRLAPFAGGWTLEAAEAVACLAGGLTDGDRTDCGVPDVLAGLTSLADKSLVQVTPRPGREPRFRLLETVRVYALDRLRASGEEEAVQRRHAAYFLALAERAESGLKGSDQRAWVDRLEREHDNLRAALRWCLAAGDAEAALRLSSLLGYFWWIGGHLAQGRTWLGEALALDRDGTAPSRTPALVWSAVLAYGQGDNGQADALADAAATLARARGERVPEAFAITARGLVAWRHGEVATAAHLHREALELAREVGDAWMIGDLLLHLGMAESSRDPAAAVEPLTESVDRLRAAGGLHHLMLALGTLADALARLGRMAEARVLFREGLELGRAGADPITATWVATFALAFLAERGRADLAVPLLAGLDAYTTSIGYGRTPLERVAHERAAAAARAQLGETRAEAAWAAGRADLPAETVLATAALLDDTPDGADSQPRGGERRSGRGLLSPREQEVLGLVAAGRSNREIAEALVVSENTAKFHVASLLNKLGAGSRAEAVTRAVGLGVLSPTAE
jgi:predicted ATPase/DNA-binding CsgD family transcriptional regulator